MIYEKRGNLRAVQLLLGHANLESTVRYVGIEVDDHLSISEQLNWERTALCDSYACDGGLGGLAVPGAKRPFIRKRDIVVDNE
jgi:hypothetical protein